MSAARNLSANGLVATFAFAAFVAGALPSSVLAEEAPLAPKQLNDPLPPSAMPAPDPSAPAVGTPRGVPQGMGNEVDATRTPGDDDPSDGINEPGRNPIPGLPRPGPDAQDANDP